MSDDLFRPEAVAFSTERLYGHVVVLPRASHVATLGFLLVGLGLLVGALTLGVRAEKQVVAGTLAYHVDHAEAELYAPPAAARALRAGQRVDLRVTGYPSELVAPIAGEVEVVGPPRPHAPSGRGGPGSPAAPVPVRVAVRADAVRAAGLTLGHDAHLAVQATVVTAEKSWLRWLADAALRRKGVW